MTAARLAISCPGTTNGVAEWRLWGPGTPDVARRHSAGVGLMDSGVAWAFAPLLSPSVVHAGERARIKVMLAVVAPSFVPTSVKVGVVLPRGGFQELGVLNDSGEAGDRVPGDHEWNGQVLVGPAPEGPLMVRASSVVPDGPEVVLSPPSRLQVVAADSPLGIATPEDWKVVRLGGADVVDREVIACFSPQTTYRRVKAAASAAGARPVGYLGDGGHCYQLRLTKGAPPQLPPRSPG
jgi:hypothetical protein